MDLARMMLAEADARRAGDDRTAAQLHECVDVARFHEQLDAFDAARSGILHTAPLAPQAAAPVLTAELLLRARDAVLDAPYRSAHRDPAPP